MKDPGRFDAVVFDCDGVLVDSEGIAGEVWVEMAAELGAGLDGLEVYRRFRGERFAICMAWLEDRLGRPLPSDFERGFRVRSRQRFADDLKPIPGVAELLDELSVPYFVASNGPRSKIELSLRLTGLLPRFEGRIFSAYELDVWKPDSRFYLEVARRLGLEAGRCAVVEDSLPGVRAAVGAGMTTFAYADRPEDGLACARSGAQVFRAMSELPGLLARSCTLEKA